MVVLALLAASTVVLSSCGRTGGGGGGGGGGGVVVSISPHTASKFPTEQQQFTAAVSGTSNTQVAWQVNGTTGGVRRLAAWITPGYTLRQQWCRHPTTR